jgi:hypothetical protein
MGLEPLLSTATLGFSALLSNFYFFFCEGEHSWLPPDREGTGLATHHAQWHHKSLPHSRLLARWCQQPMCL